ncbi:MAG: YecR family lipoprotein [Bacteroidota bacterium]
MKKIIIYPALITTAITLLNGCIVMKRKHRPGLYIESISHASHTNQKDKWIKENTLHSKTIESNLNSNSNKDMPSKQSGMELYESLTTLNVSQHSASKYTSHDNQPYTNTLKIDEWYKKIIEENSRHIIRNKSITTKKIKPVDDSVKAIWEKCGLKYETVLRLVLLFGYAGAHYWYARKYLLGCLNTFIFMGVVVGLMALFISPPAAIIFLLFYGIPDVIWWRIDVDRVKRGDFKPNCYTESKYQVKTKNIMPVAVIGGSKADGIVKVGFDYNTIVEYKNEYRPNYGFVKVPYEKRISDPFNNDVFEIDREMMHAKVMQRCNDWGYSGYEPFELYNDDCIDYRDGVCYKRRVTFECQCTNTPSNQSNKRNESSSYKDPNQILGMGTGFAINSEGYIVTNYHVIEKANKISIYHNETKKEIPAIVVAKDIKNDLAIIKIDEPNFKLKEPVPYLISSAASRMGDNVFVIGYPEADLLGKEPKYVDGKISALTGIQDDNATMQITAPVHPGNSGSPLFNDKGEIIGVINAKFTKGENVSYAIKKEALINLLKYNNISVPSVNLLKEKPVQDKVEIIKKYTYMIIIR